MKILIAKGADINSRDFNTYDKSTPLNEAISEGHLSIAKLLIEKGADVSIEDNDFQTPLYIHANNIALGFSYESIPYRQFQLMSRLAGEWVRIGG